ncbi:radical SAM protein [Haliangium sp.]|uniref:radical SAM protein n=1 Tax=Haliangium sp. TaxID=2663208 RepID=UPI003D10C1C9
MGTDDPARSHGSVGPDGPGRDDGAPRVGDRAVSAPAGQPLARTTSLCKQCKRTVAATIERVGDQVWMDKRCPEHGPQRVLISSDADWYLRTLAQAPALSAPPAPTRPVDQGCPYDCGPCAQHLQRMHLPVVPITSACNLDCPICYTHNKNDGAYHMSPDELGAILAHLERLSPDRRIINLTGGEPTLHPQFLDLVEMCHRAGIHRVTISTHGLTLLKNEPLVAALARIDARVILSFDSFQPEVNRRMLGGNFLEGKLRVLDLLGKHGVTTTLLPVLARGLNDDEVGAFVELALTRDFVRSVEFHPMTFTGQSGADFDRAARYTTIDALRDLERGSAGLLRVDDFVPSPLAHPLCYLLTYLLRLDDGRWLPFPRFMAAQDLRALLGQSLYIEPGPRTDAVLQDVINRLWSGDIDCPDADLVLSSLRRLAGEVFAPAGAGQGRLDAAERHTKAIYVHTHMDEESFDTDRIQRCCVSMPDPAGGTVPSCAYNVLYRERDSRFAPAPAPALVQLGRGRRPQDRDS